MQTIKKMVSSDMSSPFPTLEEVQRNFVTFGQQKMTKFFLDFRKKGSNLPAFLVELVRSVASFIEQQQGLIFNDAFPGDLAHLKSQQSKLTDELTSHLQAHYKEITNVSLWRERISQSLLPPQMDSNVDGFEGAAHNLALALHDLIWQVRLTSQLRFDNFEAFNEDKHNNIVGVLQPTVVFPALLYSESGNLAQQGFAY